MNLKLRRIYRTEDALYQPRNVLIEVALIPVALLILAVLVFKKPSIFSVLMALLVLASLIKIVWNFKTYGWLGKPVVAVADGILIFTQPGSTDPTLRLQLADLEEVVVYGRRGIRTFRFIRKDGTYSEVKPLFWRYLEVAVEEFLYQRLSPDTKVTVKEPQTFFAAVRGDGP